MFVTTASWVVKTHWLNKVTNVLLQFPVNCLFTIYCIQKLMHWWKDKTYDIGRFQISLQKKKSTATKWVFIITSGWCSCILLTHVFLYVCFRSNYMPNGRCHRKWRKNKSFKINCFTKTSNGRTKCSIFFCRHHRYV